MNIRQYLNISELEKWDRKNPEKMLSKLFKDCVLISTVKHKSEDTKNRFIHNGSMFQLQSGKIIICSDCYNGKYVSNIINDISSGDLVDFYLNICDNSMVFSNILDVIEYLRQVKQDHAINFDLKNLVESFISDIYKNKLIDIKEVV